MDKPLCPVCEVKHWSGEPHVFKGVSPNVSPNSGHYSRNARWRENNRERYNEYQRELMRRRRA